MQKLKILFFAANPIDTTRLELDKEIREITRNIRLAKHRDMLDLTSVWATQPDDLIQALNEHKPHIVHFSGHGSQEGEIILSDRNGRSKPLSTHAMQLLVQTLRDNIKVVLLAACYSGKQAEAITEVVDCAIGMDKSVDDQAAIVFSASFYRAIGFGRSIQEAFDQGKTALVLESFDSVKNKPQILVKKQIDPSKLFLLNSEVSVGSVSSNVHLLNAALDPHDSPYEQLTIDGKTVIRYKRDKEKLGSGKH